MLKRAIFIALVFLTPGIPAEEIFFCDFNSQSEFSRWPEIAGMSYSATEGANHSGCAKFTYSKVDNRAMSEIRIPVEKLRGRGITLTGKIRGENIRKPALSYLGPAFALKVVTPNGVDYASHSKTYGSYDWREFSAFCNVPENVSELSILIGLQQSEGTIFFDDIGLIAAPAKQDVKFNPAIQLPPPEKSRFRGVMIGHDIREEAFRELSEVWNANLIRFWIDKDKINDHRTEKGFRTIVKNRLEVLDRILPYARKYGIGIVIDMHVGPGTRVSELSSNDLSWDPEMQQLLADVWREIAARYRDEPMILGYDLLNEPREDDYVYKDDGRLDWNGLADKIARAIREVDPVTPIIVECAKWGHPAGFETLRPVSVNNVIYSFHYYQPHSYTHQGIHGRPGNLKYPGVIDGVFWNREQMIQSMKPVIDFHKKYHVPIYVGEFSAPYWAPGVEQYLDDAISIFEEYGWSWTYHSFREYHGWDAEVIEVNGKTERAGDTPRRRILLKYMKENQRFSKSLLKAE